MSERDGYTGGAICSTFINSCLSTRLYARHSSTSRISSDTVLNILVSGEPQAHKSNLQNRDKITSDGG